MATRILTLFDDEDFSEEEQQAPVPGTKPQSEGALTGQVTLPGAAAVPHEQETAPTPPAVNNDTEQQEADAVAPEGTAEPAAATEEAVENAAQPEAADAELPATDMHSDAQEHAQDAPDAAASKERHAAEDLTAETGAMANTGHTGTAGPVQPGSDIVESAQEEEESPEEKLAARADRDELDRQIVSELIQLDYTALIHKEYPFDVRHAGVVTPAKAKQEPRPEEHIAEMPEIQDEEVLEEVAPLPEWTLDKKYYTIGEVAQLFAVNTSHIRFWTNEFRLKPRTTRKGDRLYSPADIAELRLIHHLVKEKKHTIKGAREKLKAEKTGVGGKLDLKESLTGLRDMLIQIKEQL